jgi:hypothetical protein
MKMSATDGGSRMGWPIVDRLVDRLYRHRARGERVRPWQDDLVGARRLETLERRQKELAVIIRDTQEEILQIIGERRGDGV